MKWPPILAGLPNRAQPWPSGRKPDPRCATRFRDLALSANRVARERWSLTLHKPAAHLADIAYENLSGASSSKILAFGELSRSAAIQLIVCPPCRLHPGVATSSGVEGDARIRQH
jgi:hypothetical protein